ncbi:MAG: cyclic nucleotide-binding domain-containing protein [Dehalococcoidia bacterium]
MANHQDLLASVPLFAKLPRATLDRLDRILVQRAYDAGAEIVREGEIATGFYLIADGAVDVLRGADSTPVATLAKGDFFGDMALLDGLPRSATVRAAKPTTCLVMPRWDFIAEVRQNPDMAIELLHAFSLRVRDLEDRLNA